MDYLYVHLIGVLRYHASDMILTCKSDSAYFVLIKDRSRAAAWLIFSNDPNTHLNLMHNAYFHILCNTIKNVMSSTAEANTERIFM